MIISKNKIGFSKLSMKYSIIRTILVNLKTRKMLICVILVKYGGRKEEKGKGRGRESER